MLLYAALSQNSMMLYIFLVALLLSTKQSCNMLWNQLLYTQGLVQQGLVQQGLVQQGLVHKARGVLCWVQVA